MIDTPHIIQNSCGSIILLHTRCAKMHRRSSSVILFVHHLQLYREGSAFFYLSSDLEKTIISSSRYSCRIINMSIVEPMLMFSYFIKEKKWRTHWIQKLAIF